MTDRRQPGLATAASIASGLTGQAALMVSGPLVARMLGVDGRGYLAALVLWPALIAQVGTMGLPLAVTYYIAQQRVTAARIARIALLFALPQAVLLTALHAGVLLLVLRGEPSSVRIAGAITLAAVPASLAQQYGLALYQGQQRFTPFNVFRLLPSVFYAAGIATLYTVGVRSLPWVVLLLTGVNAGVGVVTLAGGLATAGREQTGSASVRPSKMLAFGLRGLFGSVSPLESFRLDQVVLALFLAPAALGLYVVGLAFANIPRFISQSVGMIAYPSVAAHADAAAARKSMWSFFWATVALSVSVVVPVVLGAGWLVPLFFGDEFGGAIRVTQILLPGMAFASARRVLSDGLRGRGHAAAGAIAEVAGWVWLAPALGALVPLWGVNGVALALSTSYVLSFGVLLAVAFARGEAQLQATLVVSPRAAWHRLRLLAAPRSP